MFNDNLGDMDAKTLMDYYKNVVQVEENINADLGLITNPEAKKGGILLVGMNPSGVGQQVYDYRECHSDFWDPKHKMMGDYDKRCGYIDLLPVRNGSQVNVHLDNDVKNRYHGKLLAFTRDYIEDLCPRLIILANLTAQYYWGFDKDYPWMGYSFEEIESPLDGERKRWSLYRITGINQTGVNRNVTTTNLKERTYFLQYRQHNAKGKVVSPSQELHFEDIQTIARFIDPEWEKTLY